MNSDAPQVGDEAALDALTAAFFDAFTTGPGCAERLERLPGLFLPQAVVVRGGPEPLVVDVAGFVAPRRALLLGGGLQEFREWETAAHTQVVGSVAQRSSRYAKEWIQDGSPHTGSGQKFLQFVHTASGWRISALAWEDDPEPPSR